MTVVLSDIFHIALRVPDLASAVAAYSAFLGYRVVAEEPVDPALADAWGAPACAGAPAVLLRPASGAASWIRLVGGGSRESPLGTLGWNGIELLVQDVDALAARLDGSPFVQFSPPQPLSLSDRVRFMQVRGPAGELLFLNQMGDPALGIPPAQSPVDRPFIVTCGSRDVAAMLAWFDARFGLASGPPQPVAMPALNRIFGLAADSRHDLGLVRLAHACLLEFDAYPAAARAKICRPRDLPDGIAVVSCSVQSLGAFSGERIARIAAPPYDGARAATVTGPEGVTLELVERPSGLGS